jgi:hypothetical protein
MLAKKELDESGHIDGVIFCTICSLGFEYDMNEPKKCEANFYHHLVNEHDKYDLAKYWVKFMLGFMSDERKKEDKTYCSECGCPS